MTKCWTLLDSSQAMATRTRTETLAQVRGTAPSSPSLSPYFWWWASAGHQGGLPTISQVVDFLMAHHSTILRKQEDYRIVEREVGMHRYMLRWRRPRHPGVLMSGGRYILMSMQRGLRVNFGRREMNDSRLQLRLLKPFLKVSHSLDLCACVCQTFCCKKTDCHQGGGES